MVAIFFFSRPRGGRGISNKRRSIHRAIGFVVISGFNVEWDIVHSGIARLGCSNDVMMASVRLLRSLDGKGFTSRKDECRKVCSAVLGYLSY